MKRFRPFCSSAAAVCAALLGFSPGPSLLADQSAPAPAGKSISFSGQINHFKLPANVKVEGDPGDGTYTEEIYGKSFTARFEGLPAGTYTVEVESAEVYRNAPNQRVMRITCGEEVLADKLDLFSAAGFAKAHTVRGKFAHQDDTMLGPLTVTFTALEDQAKFNAIRILDEKGQALLCVKAKDVADLAKAAASKTPVVSEPAIYLDPSHPVEKRVDDLIRRMSLGEKVGQLGDSASAIPRLSVPGYHYWNECLHGVARAGVATVFPQAIGMAATWDPGMLHQVAEVIATEGRAKYNEMVAKGEPRHYYGLTYWTPNINIFRDPRWGRGQETYGEDPFLTARMGVSLINGLRGDNPKYFKALACAKHFAVHNGPEKDRDMFDASPSMRDLYETYLPQFEAAVREAHVDSVMSSYNSLYQIPASCSPFLLTEILRNEWGFKGYVVSDCAATSNIWVKHHYTADDVNGVALAWKAGLDLECGGSHGALIKAVAKGLIQESDLDTALRRILTPRFRLGMFDPADACPFNKITSAEVDSPAHSEFNRQVACKSMVLLKNNGLLPLQKSKFKKIAVIGPNAKNKGALEGNYFGDMSKPIFPFDGIQAEAGTGVSFAKGCPLRGDSLNLNSAEAKLALQNAQEADVIVFVGGIDGSFEGEGHDRKDIELPATQDQMLRALQQTGKPVVFVNCSGAAVAFPWAAENLPAILQAWYPGGNGGAAIADVLFGKYNPGGKLPVTFYEKTADLPDLSNYNMANRTYRYFTGKPIYPFGHGLSYTTFAYKPVTASASPLRRGDKIHLVIPVQNTGSREGDEIVQVYAKNKASSVPQPIHSLVGFKRVSVPAGATVKAEVEVPVELLRYWSDEKKGYVVDPGLYDLQIGASSADIRQSCQVTIK